MLPCVDCSPRGLGLRSWPWLVRPILYRLSSLNARASLRTLDRVENQEGFEEVTCTPIALSLHALAACSHCMQCVRRLSEPSRLTLHAPIAEVHAGLRGTHTSAVQFSLLFSTHIRDQTSWLNCVCMHPLTVRIACIQAQAKVVKVTGHSVSTWRKVVLAHTTSLMPSRPRLRQSLSSTTYHSR
jgi:hypothetical protein